MAHFRFLANHISFRVIAPLAVGVRRGFLQAANQFFGTLPTILRVDVSLVDMGSGFLQITGRLLRSLIATLIVDMSRGFFLTADWDKGFLIAGGIMGMRPELRKGADKCPIFCVTRGIVDMNHKIRISANNISFLVIAVVRVGMQVELAFQQARCVFHSNGRQDQRCGRHRDNYSRQDSRIPAPALSQLCSRIYSWILPDSFM